MRLLALGRRRQPGHQRDEVGLPPPHHNRDARHVNPYYTDVMSERARSSKRQLGHLQETHNLLKAARIPARRRVGYRFSRGKGDTAA